MRGVCRLWCCTNHIISYFSYQLPWEGRDGTVGAQPLHRVLGRFGRLAEHRLLGKHPTGLSLKAAIMTFCSFTVLWC